MSLDVFTYGDPSAETLLVQMADDHDMELIGKEAAFISEMTGGRTFCLKAIKINNWNRDLSPWKAPAVFGNEDFGDGAAQTLEFVLKEITPAAAVAKKTFIGGYSLAALFALWAGYQTDLFDGVAAASPSIWFPEFTEYMRDNKIHVDLVYLSLGDREERTRNPVMSRVGNKIREAESILTEAGVKSTLEWNKGNHFKNADLRTAKAFAWVMTQPAE